jgi:hypothetical protein
MMISKGCGITSCRRCPRAWIGIRTFDDLHHADRR